MSGGVVRARPMQAPLFELVAKRKFGAAGRRPSDTSIWRGIRQGGRERADQNPAAVCPRHSFRIPCPRPTSRLALSSCCKGGGTAANATRNPEYGVSARPSTPKGLAPGEPVPPFQSEMTCLLPSTCAVRLCERR